MVWISVFTEMTNGIQHKINGRMKYPDQDNEKINNYGTGSLQSLSTPKLDWKHIRLLAMNRISRFSSVSRPSTAASEGSELKEEKTQGTGRHGHRKASVVAISSRSLAADKRPVHKTVSDRQGGASLAAASRAATRAAPSRSLAADKRPVHKTVSDRQGGASLAAASRAATRAAPSQSLAADKRPVHKTVSDRQGGASLAAASRAATREAPSRSLAADKRPMHKTVSDRQGGASLAVAHMARKTSIAVSSAQQPVGVSMGVRSKQRHRSETREATTQTSPALAPSDTRKESCARQTQTLPVLPRQLSAKGYQLTGVEPFARGAVQSVYLLEKRTTNGFDAPEFVIKFPSSEGRACAWEGLMIQEKLVNSDNGDQYFVPVAEKVIEDGELICHVEPKGTPVMKYIKGNKLNLKQKICLVSQTFKAVERMHAQGIANLDIQAGNLILKNPNADIQVRFCDFDFAVEIDEIDRAITVPVGTWEYMCSQAIQEKPCSPGMADLWACTLTAWVLMTSKLPVLHWVSGILSTTARRSRVLPALFEYLGLTEQGHASERKLFSDDKSVMSDECNSMYHCLTDHLCKRKTGEERKQLQLFFWQHLELPVDIDNLQLPSAEGYILKEMLSIMFFPSTYRDKFKKITGLITAASHCDELLAEHPGFDEAKVLQIIQIMGYQPCDQVERLTDTTRQLHLCSDLPDRSDEEGVEVLPGFSDDKRYRQACCQADGFMMRRHLAFQLAEQTASQDDLRAMLIDLFAEGRSLNNLEKKDDYQLSAWLKCEWRKRHEMRTFPRFKQAC